MKDNLLEKYVEKYETEVKYYSPCFSKESYDILFNRKKESEKNIVLQFLNKAYKIKSFIYDDKDLQDLINEAQKLYLHLPDFNQPIEFNCENIELKWYKIKVHIIETFKDLKLEENGKNHLILEDEKEKIKDKLGRLKTGINTVMNKSLLTNNNILDNKYKLNCSIILIINPCSVYLTKTDFYSNLLICEKLDKKELFDLEKKNKSFKIKKNKKTLTLTYNNYTYKDPEYLCIENLSNNNFNPDKKYNFDYLSKYYVKNQDKIKDFLKSILEKKVFQDIYEILFGNKEYKYLNSLYLNELIDKRLKFVPIELFDSLAISDKISISTLISIKDKTIKVQNQDQEIITKKEKEILNTGSYVTTEEHEIFHLLNYISYYENNCSFSINTPRKKNFPECKGGKYLEYLLYDQILKEINLAQALYILNESNYNKTLIDFKIGFEKLDVKDLKIEGIFSEYNKFINLEKSNIINLKSISIVQKINSRYNPKN